MVLRLNQYPNIEDLHHHSPEMVERLRQLLASGAPAKPDPCRNDFYELENGSQVFYIHISPVNGKVLLLATWLKDEEPTEITASHQAAQPCLAAAMKLVLHDGPALVALMLLPSSHSQPKDVSS